MTDLFTLEGRLALVTGSSRGLGRSLARALARAGARVIVHGRNPEIVEDARDEMSRIAGQPAGAVTFDVTDSDAVARGVEALVADHGVPDILVNNAGEQRRAPFSEFSVADWDELIGANLSGPFSVARALAPSFVARGSGKIVNIGSVQSVLARHGVARDPHAGRSVGRLQRARRTVAFPRLRRVLVRLGAEPRRRRRHDERRLSLAPRRASPVRGDARAVPGPGAGA